ncbi:hypothetical protein [Methylovirgula sp. HY1]|nr:hypothetical protein [Methylovirgula sp. HY1]
MYRSPEHRVWIYQAEKKSLNVASHERGDLALSIFESTPPAA